MGAKAGRLGMAWLGLTRGGLCLKIDDGFESPWRFLTRSIWLIFTRQHLFLPERFR